MQKTYRITLKIKSLCSLRAKIFVVLIFDGGPFEIQDGRHNVGGITCVSQFTEIK